MPRSHSHKRAILNYLRLHPGATPAEIARGVGAEAGPEFRQVLRRMVAQDFLTNSGYGRYIVLETTYRAKQGFDRFDRIEAKIAAFLRERGEPTRTKAIHLAMSGETAKGTVRGYVYVLVARVLRESDRFRQVGRGWWELVARAEKGLREVPTGRPLARL